MAQVDGTFDSYGAVGIREDLSDIIYNISPTDTPFMTAASRLSAKQTFHEWQTDSLADATTGNAVIEGDEASFTEPAATIRVGNYTQISRKTVIISGTLDAVDKAGRSREIAYQVAKRGRELKRDMEAILTANQASLAGDGTTARKLGSLRAWIETNTDLETTGGGANGGFSGGIVAAATNSTISRALTETILKGVIQSCWSEGGDPNMIMCGPVNKQLISGFLQNRSNDSRVNQQATSKEIVGAVDYYVSDFGRHMVVPNRFSPERNVYVLDTEYWGVSYLRPFRQTPLAKTGDAEKRMMIVEYTLCSKQEKASGVVADCTTTLT